MYSHRNDQGPFDPQLNEALSECFGQPLSGISLAHDTVGNAAIGAAASTQGTGISLGAGIGQDMSDAFSMEVIAHEVAHALAGGGSGEHEIDQPGDAGEDRADVAGRAFSQYVSGGLQGPAPRLDPAWGGKAKTHRFSLEGPWNAKDPVHENLTMLTIREAMGGIPEGQEGDLLGGIDRSTLPDWDSTTQHNYDPVDTPDAMQEFVRGTIWADDPKGYLFDDATGTEDYSSGLMWWEEFDEDEADEPEELIARSHYGDLQFFHAMASSDDESREETKRKMMMWARFNVMVGTGQISPTDDLSSVDIEGFSEFFEEGQAGFTVADLFGGGEGNGAELDDEIVRQRATGALLHMIQDSHAHGHTQRNDAGEIVEFHAYGNQDHDEHAALDAMGPGDDLREHIQNTPGAMDAVTDGAAVLRMMDQGADLDDIMNHLDTEVFNLAPETPQFPERPLPPELLGPNRCNPGHHRPPEPQFNPEDFGPLPPMLPELWDPNQSPQGVDQSEAIRQWLDSLPDASDE